MGRPMTTQEAAMQHTPQDDSAPELERDVQNNGSGDSRQVNIPKFARMQYGIDDETTLKIALLEEGMFIYPKEG